MSRVKRNNSIDIFRLIASILVVGIHAEPFLDQNVYLGFFASQVITRVAVPFFFCVSGYYFYQGLQSGKATVFGTFWKYLSYYAFWSLVYYIINIVSTIVSGQTNIDWLSYIKNFFVFGSVYHFWYFIAILVSVVVFGLCYRLQITKWMAFISTLFYILGVLTSAYYHVFENIKIFEVLHNYEHVVTLRRIFCTGLPFFCSGFFVDKLWNLEKNKKTLWKIVVLAGCFGIEILGVKFLGLAESITITFGLYLFTVYGVVFLLKTPLEGKEQIAKKCRGLSSYIYCIHPMFLTLFSGVRMSNVIKMGAVLITSAISWWVFAQLNKKLNSQMIKRYIVDN